MKLNKKNWIWNYVYHFFLRFVIFFVFSQPAKLDNLVNIIKLCLICSDYLRFFFLLLLLLCFIVYWRENFLNKEIGLGKWLFFVSLLHGSYSCWTSLGWLILSEKKQIKNINLLVESIATIVNLLVLSSVLNWLVRHLVFSVWKLFS